MILCFKIHSLIDVLLIFKFKQIYVGKEKAQKAVDNSKG